MTTPTSRPARALNPQIAWRRAADEALIAAIFGEPEDVSASQSPSAQPPVAVPGRRRPEYVKAWRETSKAA